MNIMIYMVQGRELHAGEPAGTPNIHRVSHGCIAWLFRKLSFSNTPVTLIGMPEESILSYNSKWPILRDVVCPF